MAALASDLRRQLENVCIAARDKAEDAARSALQKRAVDAAEPFPHFSAPEKELRNRLRARGRQVGDVRHGNKKQEIEQLTQELAYEYWHRMLFARFLAENNLLMHPDGVAVSLEECEELAKSEKAPNGFVLAARYASRMLPQVFRTDDVLLDIEFAPEQRLALEKELAKLPRETFLADDGLGWVYQFWQTKKKDEVNASGDKIDGRTLPAVTQLFTEDYMVQFLVHNTIGAWWCARHGIKGPPGGAGLPAGKSPIEMPYLRWREDGTPAAGSFDGWPKSLKEFTMLDPCCGSGHFLVNAFNLLVRLRMHDERFLAKDACDAVLRDNLFGLELDPRCTQIAAFALALAAWRFPGEDGQPLGYRELPQLHIACSGQSVAVKKEEWLALANDDSRLREGMDKLYDLFIQAPHLGSLIDPRRDAGDMFVAGFSELQPLLNKALIREGLETNVEAAAVGVAAQGIAKATSLLGSRYVLIATNVPYLVRNKQGEIIWKFCEEHHTDARGDLAAAFLSSLVTRQNVGGTLGIVCPQNMLFLQNYKHLRKRLLETVQWNAIARLGPGGFETISGAVVNVALLILTNNRPDKACHFVGLDVVSASTPSQKATGLLQERGDVTSQHLQLTKPDCRIEFGGSADSDKLLAEYGVCYQGLVTGDQLRFTRNFWEVQEIGSRWSYLKSSCDHDGIFGGQSQVILWEGGNGQLAEYAKENRDRLHDMHESGNRHWGKKGIAIDRMTLRATLYTGEPYDNNTAVIIPRKSADLLAVLAYCRSKEYVDRLRSFDHSLKFTNQTLVKVPFDLTEWQSRGADQFPDGLPKPVSDDPAQWLFSGDIRTSTAPMLVAVARLLGYQWPEQTKGSPRLETLAVKDGVVCIPPVRGESSASERLQEVLHAAYGKDWSPVALQTLMSNAGSKPGMSLDDWLRNSYFEQNCKLFNNRPFVWHIWDGRKDGFSCLVNYHKLNYKTLENLTYSYLGDWIKAQAAEVKTGKTGADLRLGAAQQLQEKLKLILTGEPPFDIFIRWKPLSEQPIGWHPDLNDGVRMNIRPFVEAGILRKNPNIKWTKDRGNEPERNKHDYPWFWSDSEFVGDRVNDIHLANEKKAAARNRQMGAK